MQYKKYWISLLFSGFILLFIAASQLTYNISPAKAQCGSQESSCQNCHEVQAQASVNSDGTGWHESHAFGDFCYLCHAGNQQAMEKEAAHTGMVPPLSDVDASCKLCHADDLTERAQVYAVALGIDLTNSGDNSDQAAPTNIPDITPLTSESAPQVQPVVSISNNNKLVVDDPNMVDYAQRYDEIVLGKRPTNWGNIILIALIGLLVVGGGGFVLLNEMRINTVNAATQKVEAEYPVDVIEMLPFLTSLKFQSRKALKRLLT